MLGLEMFKKLSTYHVMSTLVEAYQMFATNGEPKTTDKAVELLRQKCSKTVSEFSDKQLSYFVSDVNILIKRVNIIRENKSFLPEKPIETPRINRLGSFQVERQQQEITALRKRIDELCVKLGEKLGEKLS